MANYNEHKCFACGQIFDYCRRCAITPVVYKAEGFCSEQCSDIFNILSKHGCNLISADEALKELEAYNIDEITLTEDILAHIERIKSEVPAPIVKEKVVDEKLIIKSNKNNKKKW
jgi:hypothetical protein